MENFKKLMEQNDYCSMTSSDDNETDNEELSVWNLERLGGDVPMATVNSCVGGVSAKAIKKRNGEERLPTRRPDPNVYNRNALLARENRRKKKMYLETIEKELQDAKKVNLSLMKALKRQLKIARRLEQEKKYFQTIFENRSDILSVLTALNVRRHPSESNKSPFSSSSDFDYDNSYNCRNISAVTANSCSSSSHDAGPLTNHLDNPSDGSIIFENQTSSGGFSSLDFCTFPDFFTDLDDVNRCSLPACTSWEDLWNNGNTNDAGEDFTVPATSSRNDNIKAVNDDHCYVASITLDPIPSYRKQSELAPRSPPSECSLDLDVGTDNVPARVCLHFGGGEDCVEFCPTCQWNSATSRTPPLQLFNDERSA